MDTSGSGRNEVVRELRAGGRAGGLAGWHERPLSESIERRTDAFAEAFTDKEPATMIRAFPERKR